MDDEFDVGYKNLINEQNSVDSNPSDDSDSNLSPLVMDLAEALKPETKPSSSCPVNDSETDSCSSEVTTAPNKRDGGKEVPLKKGPGYAKIEGTKEARCGKVETSVGEADMDITKKLGREQGVCTSVIVDGKAISKSNDLAPHAVASKPGGSSNMRQLKNFVNFYKVTKTFEQKFKSVKTNVRHRLYLSMSSLGDVKDAISDSSSSGGRKRSALRKCKSEADVSEVSDVKALRRSLLKGVIPVLPSVELYSNMEGVFGDEVDETHGMNDPLAIGSVACSETYALEKDPLGIEEDLADIKPLMADLLKDAQLTETPRKGLIKLRNITELVDSNPAPSQKRLNIPVKVDLKSMKVSGQTQRVAHTNVSSISKPYLCYSDPESGVQDDGFNPRIEASFSLAGQTLPRPGVKLNIPSTQIKPGPRPGPRGPNKIPRVKYLYDGKKITATVSQEPETITGDPLDTKEMMRMKLEEGANIISPSEDSTMPSHAKLLTNYGSQKGKILTVNGTPVRLKILEQPDSNGYLMPRGRPKIDVTPDNFSPRRILQVKQNGHMSMFISPLSSQAPEAKALTPPKQTPKSSPLKLPTRSGETESLYAQADTVTISVPTFVSQASPQRSSCISSPQATCTPSTTLPQTTPSASIAMKLGTGKVHAAPPQGTSTPGFTLPQGTSSFAIPHTNTDGSVGFILLAGNQTISGSQLSPLPSPGSETVIGNIKLVKPNMDQTASQGPIQKPGASSRGSSNPPPKDKSPGAGGSKMLVSPKVVPAQIFNVLQGDSKKFDGSMFNAMNTLQASNATTALTTLEASKVRKKVTQLPSNVGEVPMKMIACGGNTVPSKITIAKTRLLFRNELIRKEEFARNLLDNENGLSDLRLDLRQSKHVCGWCGTGFVKRYLLHQHTHRVTCQMVYECIKCDGKRILFSNRCQLLLHLLMHYGSQKKIIINYSKLKIFQIKIKDVLSSNQCGGIGLEFNSDDETEEGSKVRKQGPVNTEKSTQPPQSGVARVNPVPPIPVITPVVTLPRSRNAVTVTPTPTAQKTDKPITGAKAFTEPNVKDVLDAGKAGFLRQHSTPGQNLKSLEILRHGEKAGRSLVKETPQPSVSNAHPQEVTKNFSLHMPNSTQHLSLSDYLKVNERQVHKFRAQKKPLSEIKTKPHTLKMSDLKQNDPECDVEAVRNRADSSRTSPFEKLATSAGERRLSKHVIISVLDKKSDRLGSIESKESEQSLPHNSNKQHGGDTNASESTTASNVNDGKRKLSREEDDVVDKKSKIEDSSGGSTPTMLVFNVKPSGLEKNLSVPTRRENGPEVNSTPSKRKSNCELTIDEGKKSKTEEAFCDSPSQLPNSSLEAKITNIKDKISSLREEMTEINPPDSTSDSRSEEADVENVSDTSRTDPQGRKDNSESNNFVTQTGSIEKVPNTSEHHTRTREPKAATYTHHLDAISSQTNEVVQTTPNDMNVDENLCDTNTEDARIQSETEQDAGMHPAGRTKESHVRSVSSDHDTYTKESESEASDAKNDRVKTGNDDKIQDVEEDRNDDGGVENMHNQSVRDVQAMNSESDDANRDVGNTLDEKASKTCDNLRSSSEDTGVVTDGDTKSSKAEESSQDADHPSPVPIVENIDCGEDSQTNHSSSTETCGEDSYNNLSSSTETCSITDALEIDESLEKEEMVRDMDMASVDGGHGLERDVVVSALGSQETGEKAAEEFRETGASESRVEDATPVVAPKASLDGGEKPRQTRCRASDPCPVCRTEQRGVCFSHKRRPVLRYTCSTYCQAILSSACSLAVHLNLHRREAPFICPSCGIELKMYLALTRHVMKCQQNRLVMTKCPYCEFYIEHGQELYLVNKKTTTDALKAHFTAEHMTFHPKALPDRLYSCKICSGPCPPGDAEALFQRHCVRKNTFVYRYKCELCGEVSPSQTAHRKRCPKRVQGTEESLVKVESIVT